MSNMKNHLHDRLEYLRSQINAERISYGEIAELQGLVQHIGPGDVQLLEWARVPEHDDVCDECQQDIPDSEQSMVNSHHATSCSLYTGTEK